MMYRLLADAILVFHFLFVVFVVVGGFLALKWRWLMWIHIPVAVWGAGIEFAGGVCPLTPLENQFREKGGQEGYDGSFIDQYIVKLVYPKGLTRTHQLLLGLFVLSLNAFVYWKIITTSGKTS